MALTRLAIWKIHNGGILCLHTLGAQIVISEIARDAAVAAKHGKCSHCALREFRLHPTGAGEELAFIRILQNAGVIAEVEDRCDMFLWWWNGEKGRTVREPGGGEWVIEANALNQQIASFTP